MIIYKELAKRNNKGDYFVDLQESGMRCDVTGDRVLLKPGLEKSPALIVELSRAEAMQIAKAIISAEADA